MADRDFDGVPDVAENVISCSRSTGTLSSLLSNVYNCTPTSDVTLETDSDGDGLPDYSEIILGSDFTSSLSPPTLPISNGLPNAVNQYLAKYGITSSGVDGNADGDVFTDSEEALLGLNPGLNSQPVPWINISQERVGGVTAIRQGQGVVIVEVLVRGRQQLLDIDWSNSDVNVKSAIINASRCVDSNRLKCKKIILDSDKLSEGQILTFSVNVSRHNLDKSKSTPHSNYQLKVKVMASSVDKESIKDDDFDGRPDSKFIAKRAIINSAGVQFGDIRALGDMNLEIRYGDVARYIDPSPGITVQEADFVKFYGRSDGTFLSTIDIHNIQVVSLPEVGAQSSIIYQLSNPVPLGTSIARVRVGDEWRDFVEDAQNRVYSVRVSGTGGCPTASNVYFRGLFSSANCVKLDVQDGGRNDEDEQVNGSIRNSFFVGTYDAEIVVDNGLGGVGFGGGCTLGEFSGKFDWAWILLLLLSIAVRFAHRKGFNRKETS